MVKYPWKVGVPPPVSLELATYTLADYSDYEYNRSILRSQVYGCTGGLHGWETGIWIIPEIPQMFFEDFISFYLTNVISQFILMVTYIRNTFPKPKFIQFHNINFNPIILR